MDGYHVEETDITRKTSYSPATSDSDTDGDDLGDDEDIEFRKNITPILNLGQTITALWPISLIEHAEDVENDYEENLVLSSSSSSSYFSKEGLIARKHRRAPSLPSQLKLDEIKLKLDEIQLNNDEYGFNPKRTKSRRLGSTRPISLCSSNERISDIIGFGISKPLDDFFLSMRDLDYTKSLARNAKEAKIEREIAELRSQPSKVEFSRKNKAKENFNQLLNHRSARKAKQRSKSLRRKLSFDSHPRRRAFSETESISKKSRKNYMPVETSKDRDVKNDSNLSINFKSKEYQMNLNRCDSDPSFSKQCEIVKVAPPPVLKDKQIFEVLVSKVPDEEKGKRKRTAIPQFLHALKLPNKKTIKKFMRKKNDQNQKSAVPSMPLQSEKIPDLTEEGACNSKEYISTSSSINTFDKSAKRSSEKRSNSRRLYSTSSSGSRISCSLCSLPRVQEGKECSQTDGSLSRKSCSTCSIVVAKFLGGSKETNVPVLERRMSDTALTWREERQPGCSPGRRFIYRLLSPVVCGLNSEKYSNMQTYDSYASLTSCSSDISAEAEFFSQKLSDFDPVEVAEELALIDKELLIRITWQELSNCGWMSRNKYVSSPNVMNMVEFFNRVAMMVASNILAEDSVHLRAKIISRMIKLAYRCKVLKNYNSLRAVLGGLQCTPIFRLKASWKQVRSKRKRLFSELSNLMGETDNFATYRAELNRSLKDPPCLPFLGDFLTQIAQTQAYIAVQRKRSLAKQRLEKSSVGSSSGNTAVMKTSNINEQESSDRVLVSKNHGMIKEHGNTNIITDPDDVKIANKEINNEVSVEGEALEENLKKNSEESRVLDPIQHGDSLSSSSANIERTAEISEHYTENNLSDIKNRCLSPNLLSIKVQNLENANLIDLHDIVLRCSPYKINEEDSKEDIDLNNDFGSSNLMNLLTDASMQREESDDEEMKPIDDKANVCQSSTRESCRDFLGSDYEILELSNIEQENPEVNDIAVFADDDQNEQVMNVDEVLHSSCCTVVDCGANPTCAGNVQLYADASAIMRQGSVNEGYRIEQPSCPEDKGIYTPTSSIGDQHFLSPGDKITDIKLSTREELEKRTHARCDSNDSGVVLHNGRSSRASDDINGSRENLDLVVTGTDNSAFDDSKHHEIDVIAEDAVDVTDNYEDNEDDEKVSQIINKIVADPTSVLLKENHEEETKKIEQKIKTWKPIKETTTVQKEFQFWQYQIACMHYTFPSRPSVRRFLLNACYNSEEENYSLSLKQEPISKKF